MEKSKFSHIRYKNFFFCLKYKFILQKDPNSRPTFSELKQILKKYRY